MSTTKAVSKSKSTLEKPREKKYFGRFKKPLAELPNLVKQQLDSFEWISTDGLKEVFKEISPINDYSEKKFELDFVNFEIAQGKFIRISNMQHVLHQRFLNPN